MFAYCLNNPVNRTDICGKTSLWYYLIVDHDMGFIHRMVQLDILANSGPEISVELVLPGLGRADIVDTTRGAVWEVKHAGKTPELREWIALAQAVGYIGGEHQGVLIECLGDVGHFQGEFLISCLESTYLVTYCTPNDGVVLYSVKEITGLEHEYEHAAIYAYVPKNTKKPAVMIQIPALAIAGGPGGLYVDGIYGGTWGKRQPDCYSWG